MDLNAATTDSEGIQLYRLLLGGYITLFPVTALFLGTAMISNSASVGVICVQSLISIIINTFSLYALRQVIRSNVYRFAYGAGKLEDFSAFLLGAFYVPSGLYLLYCAVGRIIHAPEVGYALSQIAVVISAARMLVLYLLVRRLMRQSGNPSPLLLSSLLDYRLCLLNDLGVLIAFAIAWGLLQIHLPAIGYRIDPLVALAISLYMLWIGGSLVWRNFRSLIDLPLPESQQIKIMSVLARHYHDYDAIGIVYSRASGKRRFVEIELGFAGEQTVKHIRALSRRMEKDLAAEVPGLAFRIIPAFEYEAVASDSGSDTEGDIHN